MLASLVLLALLQYQFTYLRQRVLDHQLHAGLDGSSDSSSGGQAQGIRKVHQSVAPDQDSLLAEEAQF